MTRSEHCSTQQDQSDHHSDSADRAALLAPAELIQAIAGRFTGDSPLIGWARELGDLHAELLPLRRGSAPRADDLDGERVRTGIDRVIDEIDDWAARHVTRTRCGRVHTHSLGNVMSHIAKTYAEAWWAVLHTADVEVRHHAWLCLGEVRQGYADMVDEIRGRHLRLPFGTGVIQRGGSCWS
ncbi:hypothetical protein [Nocardia asteroides]|uniref:hypothetical protein n=1 Tax=Nocardia asteroides TaxID=1824 RepID=UPI00343465DB